LHRDREAEPALNQALDMYRRLGPAYRPIANRVEALLVRSRYRR
jgi:hypothetical protein